MALDRAAGHTQLPGHLRMVETAELIQQKGLAHGRLQAIEQLRDPFQGLQRLVAHLR